MAVAITQTANPAGVAASSTVATYTSVSIGAAAASRIVVVLVGTETASSTPSACTIDYGAGAVAMTAGTTGSTGSVFARAFYLLVPTGIVATIRVTFSATSPGNTANHIAVYSVTGGKFSSAGGDGSTDMDSTDPLTTGSITIPTNGGFIAVAAGATDTVAKTWANATEDIDDDAGTFRFTTATRTTALTTTAVTCTGTTNGEDGGLSYIIFAENSAPTVALNSPADASSDTDTTPTLEFTGTDADGDTITYQVQIDTANTFGSSTTIFSDTFTEGGGNVLLQSHTPTTGTSWTRLYSDTSDLDLLVNATTDTLRSEANSGDHGVIYTADATYPTADYYIQTTFTDDENASFFKWYWLLRVQDENNMYAFVIFAGANASRFYKKVAGTWTALGDGLTMLTHFVNGDVLKIEVVGSTLNLYIDDVLSLSTTDSSITAAGKAGVATGGGAELIDSTDDAGTGWQWDDLTIVATTPPLIERTSDINAGFINQDNGADFDPFDSGDEIGFTTNE